MPFVLESTALGPNSRAPRAEPRRRRSVLVAALAVLTSGPFVAHSWALATTGHQTGAAPERPVGPPSPAQPGIPAQRGGPGQAAPARGDRALDLAARDRRTGFDATSAQAARLELQGLRPADPRRPLALLTLGAAKAIAERGTLLSAAAEGPTPDRVAALLGLGELGSGIADGLELLERLATAETGQVQSACLVALARSNEPLARAVLSRFASGEGDLAEQAKEVMAHAIEPGATPPPLLWRHLYDLRWEAARRFGTVDGRPWRLVRIDELAQDKAFLESLVLWCAPNLTGGTADDLLLELVLRPGRSLLCIDAAVRALPDEMERMIDADVWRPANRSEWLRVVDSIVAREDWARFPNTLLQAAVIREARPLVAGFMHSAGGPFEEALLEALASDDPRDRANAAYSIGAAGISDYTTILRGLAEDPEPWVAASALASRVRLGEAAALREVEALFATPPERRTTRLSAFLFEHFDRAAPDADVLGLLERLAPTLAEADRINADAILAFNGRRADRAALRVVLPTIDPTTIEAYRIVRALGFRPSVEDLEALARVFPFDNAPIANLHTARALVEGRHRVVDQLLASAVWTLDWNVATLAAGIVYETRGGATLRQWVVRPPATAREEDIRRVGFALGAWGGPKEVDALRAALGTTRGAEEVALQGAVFGTLGARTR
jgi:hypothetical protein